MTRFVLLSGLAVLLYMTLIFVIALFRRDNSIADIAWGPGFILVALLTFFLEEGHTFRHILVTGLVILWGLRLAVHIFLRNRRRSEDYRYAQWRQSWGRWFVLRSYVQVFILQGFLLLLISFEVMLVNHSIETGVTALDVAGCGVWLVGFFFEAVGDYELREFKKKPENRGKLMTSGLWRLTRHPNYFGEAAMWWGIFLVALSVRNGWTAVVSPLVITFLIINVSGVRMLEKKYRGNKEFEEYARRTSAFFPWFPKKLG